MISAIVREWSLTAPFAAYSSGRSPSWLEPRRDRPSEARQSRHGMVRDEPPKLLFSTKFDSHKFILLIKRYSHLNKLWRLLFSH